MDNKIPKIKILVACHKADPNIRQDDIYMPIQVGAALHPKLDLGFQKDNEGENISEKNASYCELTALYWAWKNLPKDVEYVGLAHYRRYFDINNKKIEKILNNNRVIVAKPQIFPTNLFKDYAEQHNGLDLKETYQIIKESFPQYKTSFEKTILRNNRLSPFNMFIMRRELFDEFCTFIFGVLFELEKRINLTNYNDYQKRIFGFISERLLNVFLNYIETNNKNVNKIYINIIQLVDNKISYLNTIINNFRYSISYSLSKSKSLNNSLKLFENS